MSKAGSEGTAADLIIPPQVKGPPFEPDEPGPPATIQSAATYIGKDKIATEAETIRLAAGRAKNPSNKEERSQQNEAEGHQKRTAEAGGLLGGVAAASQKSAKVLAELTQRGVERVGSVVKDGVKSILRSTGAGKE